MEMGNLSATDVSGDVMAIAARGGWKERSPLLFMYDLRPRDVIIAEQSKSTDEYILRSLQNGHREFMEMTQVCNPGFSEVGWGVCVDLAHDLVWHTVLPFFVFRPLILTQGDNRIKGFSANWKDSGKLRFTLSVGESVRPLMVVGDTLFCAAQKRILMWDITKLTKHEKSSYINDKSGAIGGVREDIDDVYMSDEDDVEVIFFLSHFLLVYAKAFV